MNKKWSFLLLVLVFAALIAGAYILYGQLGQQMASPTLATKAPQTEAVQQTAAAEETAAAEQTEATQGELAPVPDFTVYDLEGNPVKLSDFRGKPVVLNFWASWCGPCKMEMPDLDAAYAQYGQQVHFLMVNLTDGAQETVESASALITQLGYSFPVYYDTDMEAAIAYGVRSIPVTYFIDAQGYGVAYYPGAMSMDILQTGIGMILPEA